MDRQIKIIVVITLCTIASACGKLIAEGERYPKSSNGSEGKSVYTGLIIDARGLDIVAQKKWTNLYNEQNKKVCRPFDRKYLFTSIESNAIDDNIVGDNPLCIKAKATHGNDKTGIIVYNNDAKRIKNNLLGGNIFKKGKIVVLIGNEKPHKTKDIAIKPVDIGRYLNLPKENICQENENTVAGSGLIIYGDKDRARNEAMYDAYGKSLGKFLGVNSHTKGATSNYAVFKDIVNGTIHGFIKQLKIIAENEKDNVYCVEVGAFPNCCRVFHRNKKNS